MVSSRIERSRLRRCAAAVAVSDSPAGPFKLVDSFRPNGHMSRDMGLFVDDDDVAYHIYSSDENYELRLAKLTPDYLAPTTADKLLFRNHREAPALFKYNKKYYLFTSGCTGWAPNKAELHVADDLFGPWTSLGDPMRGPDAHITLMRNLLLCCLLRARKMLLYLWQTVGNLKICWIVAISGSLLIYKTVR